MARHYRILYVLVLSLGLGCNIYAQELTGVFIQRHVTHVVETDEFIVVEKIYKNKISGFGKYAVQLSSGPKINFTVVSAGKANVSYDATTGMAKFIWVSLPAEEPVIFLSYKLTGFEKINYSYEGEFKFIVDNILQIVNIQAENCSYNEQ